MNAQRVMEPEENPFLAAFYEGDRGAAFRRNLHFSCGGSNSCSALDLGPHSKGRSSLISSSKKTSCLPA